MKLLYVTDSIDRLVKHTDTYDIKKFGLIKKTLIPKWWFIEKCK